MQALLNPTTRDRVAERAKEMIDDARRLQNSVLKMSLMSLVQGGARDVKLGDHAAEAWARPWLEQADRRIDEHFFDALFEHAETGSCESWGCFLQLVARETFKNAAASLPTAGARRLKALAIAEDRMENSFFRQFKDYFPKSVEDIAHA